MFQFCWLAPEKNKCVHGEVLCDNLVGIEETWLCDDDNDCGDQREETQMQ